MWTSVEEYATGAAGIGEQAVRAFVDAGLVNLMRFGSGIADAEISEKEHM
jgi:hypothetical protein